MQAYLMQALPESPSRHCHLVRIIVTSIMIKLNSRDVLIVGVALFAMFFGAGNLIFPPCMGLLAGGIAAWPGPGSQPRLPDYRYRPHGHSGRILQQPHKRMAYPDCSRSCSRIPGQDTQERMRQPYTGRTLREYQKEVLFAMMIGFIFPPRDAAAAGTHSIAVRQAVS